MAVNGLCFPGASHPRREITQLWQRWGLGAGGVLLGSGTWGQTAPFNSPLFTLIQPPVLSTHFWGSTWVRG